MIWCMALRRQRMHPTTRPPMPKPMPRTNVRPTTPAFHRPEKRLADFFPLADDPATDYSYSY